MKTKTTWMHARYPPALYTKIIRFAERHGITLSRVVRRIVCCVDWFVDNRFQIVLSIPVDLRHKPDQLKQELLLVVDEIVEER